MSQAAVSADRTDVVPAVRVRMSPIALAIVGLVAGACVLRITGLGRESLWLDEGYTLLFSGLPLPKLLTVGGAHEHPPLYYLLVHAAMSVWPSYLVPRAIAAAAGGLSVLVIYLLGRRLHSSVAGAVAAVLLAVSPFHVWYSQNGRGYELAGLWVLLSYLMLFRASDARSGLRWALYAVATLLALYTEYTTALVLLPQALFLLRSRRPLILSWLVVLVGYLPWAGVLWRDTAAVAGDYWIPPPTAQSVVATALEFLGVMTPCPSPPCSGQEVAPIAGHGTEVVVIMGLLLIAAILWVSRWDVFTTSVLVAWLVVPFAIVLPLAAVRSLYVDRIFLDATFPLYLLIGMAIAASLRWKGWMAGAALVALLFVGNVLGVALVRGQSSNPDWRSLARDLNAAYRPGQAVMFNPGVLRSLVGAYLPRGWHATRERSLWSRSYLDVPGWQRYYPDAAKTDRASRARVEAVLRDRQLADVTRGVRDTWLVTFDYPGMNDTRRWFSDHGFQPLVSELYDGDTRLELWSRDNPSFLGRPITGTDFSGWRQRGKVQRAGGEATLNGPSALETSFPVRPGRAYSAGLEYRGAPPGGPAVSVRVLDKSGREVARFPRTMWYELPLTGVWLQQPFGFVAPPGAARAVISIENRWGQVRYRNVRVFSGDGPAS